MRFLLALLLTFALPAEETERASEEFIDGYVRSAIEREIELDPGAFDVTVRGRDVVVWLDAPSGDLVARVQELLDTLEGVGKTEVRERPEGAGGTLDGWREPTEPSERITSEKELFLPPSKYLFRPLFADPKEPAFFTSWRRYRFEGQSRVDVIAVGMGGAIPLWRNNPTNEHRFQLSIEAGVFSEFNMDDKANLLNSDYIVGFPFHWRHDDFSARFRVYHQSSHLGDETLVEGMREIYDLSYEAVELLLSYEQFGFRVYGGGEYVVRRTPDDLDQKQFHWGAEARTPEKLFDAFRLAGGVDVKYYQEFNYTADVSVRGGFIFGDAKNEIQVMLEYFDGHSPHGQFLLQEVEFYGIGVYYRF